MSLIKDGPFAHFDCGSDCQDAMTDDELAPLRAAVQPIMDAARLGMAHYGRVNAMSVSGQPTDEYPSPVYEQESATIERAAMLACARAQALGEQRAFDALIGNWGWEHLESEAHYLPILWSAIECDQGEQHEHQVIDIDTVLRLRKEAKAAAEALVARLEGE